ncbi:formamidopyrimidine-DNA glycosylase-like [Panicum miliaceum]|uniref:DNA-(apurinic or apyrimidinic site) lyase n=2 Tax=Magnoliopsida TaxID=3398 RepID=A0A3L6R9D0_PANMI|nr:formamidopyrimidine-DNA glycosylase-like [Panicum miliaceum]
MPELPEVEAARQALQEHCVGKRIVKCASADDTKVIDGVTPDRLEAALVGRTIAAARRKGKNLWLALDSPPHPTFQFGMAGAIYIKGVELSKYKRSAVSSTEEWPSKYSKLFVQMDDGLEFSFTDKRRFAKIRLVDNPEAVPPISELGPDALFEPMKLDEFVKSLGVDVFSYPLLFQSFISGIGNWMADEVLYQPNFGLASTLYTPAQVIFISSIMGGNCIMVAQMALPWPSAVASSQENCVLPPEARIHPMQTASKISKDKCATLHLCIKEVIDKSLEVGADSSQFPDNWIFHSREKKPGKAFVDGKKIDFIAVGGRTSAYVPELQKLDAADAETSRSKKSVDKENDDDKKSRKGINAPKPAKTRVKAAKGSSNKAGNTSDDGDEEDYEEEEAKPAKRSRKQSARAANVSTKNAGSTHGDEATDEDQEAEEDAEPAKRGRKQIEKTVKGSDEEADDKMEVKPGKRGQKTQPTEAKSSLPKKVQGAGPARRPQRKARQT